MVEHWNGALNVLAQKYLGVPASENVDGTVERLESKSETVVEIGTLRPVFVAVGLYYCSSIDQFGEVEDGIVDPRVDGVGRIWRLVSTEYLSWMAGMVGKAFENDQVNSADLSAAILKFYRVRERLEAAAWARDAEWEAWERAGGRGEPSLAGTHKPGGGEGEEGVVIGESVSK